MKVFGALFGVLAEGFPAELRSRELGVRFGLRQSEEGPGVQLTFGLRQPGAGSGVQLNPESLPMRA